MTTKQDIIQYLKELTVNIPVKTTSFKDERSFFHNDILGPMQEGTFFMHVETILYAAIHLIEEYDKDE
jgi:hypothetical protein